MADILIRSANWMGGGSDLEGWQSGERPFFRGQRLTKVSPDDRVYFVEKGENPGEGRITGYALYTDYRPSYGDNMTDTGWLDAFIVKGPYVPLDTPVPMTDGYRGQWRARYVHTVYDLDERLRRVAP